MAVPGGAAKVTAAKAGKVGAKKLGEAAAQKMSKRAAMRQAKRDAGIPTSQTHRTHIKNQKADACGGKGTEYVFDGNKRIQDHYQGHKYVDGNKVTTLGPHWNNHPATKNHYWY